MSICTGTNNPATCPACRLHGACPMGGGQTVTPMNQAARDAMDKQGKAYDRSASELLQSIFDIKDNPPGGNT
jgi:hypothetical protein